jgi:GDP-fucose transporter C1
MVTVNKWVLLTTSIPIFFLFVQLSIAVILLLLCQALKLITLPHWDPKTAKALLPLIGINVSGLIFNNLCLQYVDASFYQIARGLVLPITVSLALALQQSPPSLRATACCVGVTAGFSVGVLFDSYSTRGAKATSM